MSRRGVPGWLASTIAQARAHKVQTALNVLGLATGLASCVLIGLFVRHEQSYEAGFSNADRIYRISRDYFARDGARARVPASMNAPVGPALADELPAVERAARVFGGGLVIGLDDQVFHEPLVRFADPELFQIFDFRWRQGNPAGALGEPFTMVLTESMAARYFGDADPVGRTLSLDGAAPLRVTGVIADLPDNTHLHFSALISLSTLTSIYGNAIVEQWNSMTDFHTYLLLREGTSAEAVAEAIPGFMSRHMSEEAVRVSGMTLTEIGDIHLHSNRDEEWRPAGSLATVYSFAAIAAGILLIACINFMNLSTARGAQRAREVAVRKSVGATRRQLVCQLLAESMSVAVVAAVLAMALVELLLPWFSTVVGVDLELDYRHDPALLVGIVGLTVVVGLVAGSYPALYLSAFRPAPVLRGDLTRGSGGIVFRNLLVVFQFSIAIALLISLAVVYRQSSFARQIDLGFEKDRIVLLTAAPREGFGEQWTALKQQLLQHPGVESITASHYTPFSFDDNQIPVRQSGDRSFNRIQWMLVGFDFFETYRIELLAGRAFSPEFPADVFPSAGAGAAGSSGFAASGGAGVIINRAAAKLFGWLPEAAVGQVVEVGADERFEGRIDASVVGVVDDTHFESVRVQVRPMIFVLSDELRFENFNIRHASIRVSGRNLADTLAHLDATWRTLMPHQPLARRFLNDDFEALYQQEHRQQVLLGGLSLLAILIACLGLFGLAAFSAERRTREIGVRKAFGGSVGAIVRLLTGDFSRLVLASNLLAWPAAYLVMRNWLDSFAYRIDLSVLEFAAASLVALAVAWLTVAGIAARAATASPVRALRYE